MPVDYRAQNYGNENHRDKGEATSQVEEGFSLFDVGGNECNPLDDKSQSDTQGIQRDPKYDETYLAPCKGDDGSEKEDNGKDPET